MRSLLIPALALVAATSSTGAAAQQPDSVLPGVRVRVTTSAPGFQKRYSGTLIAITPESVTVGGTSPQLTLPAREIDKLELSLGASHGRSAKKGLRRGLIIGGIMGVFMGVQAARAPVCGQPPTSSLCRAEGMSASALVVNNTIFFGALCGAAGLTIGALRKSERWKEVPIPGDRSRRTGAS